MFDYVLNVVWCGVVLTAFVFEVIALACVFGAVFDDMVYCLISGVVTGTSGVGGDLESDEVLFMITMAGHHLCEFEGVFKGVEDILDIEEFRQPLACA